MEKGRLGGVAGRLLVRGEQGAVALLLGLERVDVLALLFDKHARVLDKGVYEAALHAALEGDEIGQGARWHAQNVYQQIAPEAFARLAFHRHGQASGLQILWQPVSVAQGSWKGLPQNEILGQVFMVAE